MDFIYSAFQYVANVFGSISDFISTIPDLIVEIFSYAWFWAIKFYITFKIQMIELAYSVAIMVLKDYEVYTVLNAAFNSLPSDLRFAAYNFGVVDAVRIVIDAFTTAFVLRMMGW